MKKLLILLTLMLISGCGTYYTVEDYVEKDYISNSAGFFDPSGAYAWRLYDYYGKEIVPNKNHDGRPKIMKVKILSVDTKPVNKDVYIWFGSMDSNHTSPDSVTGFTPVNVTYLVNLAEKDKQYTLTTPENTSSGGWIITKSPIIIEDYKNDYVSVDKGQKVTFIKEELYPLDEKNSFKYNKEETNYGLFRDSTIHFSVKRNYKRITLKAYSDKDHSEINFDSGYIREYK